MQRARRCSSVSRCRLVVPSSGETTGKTPEVTGNGSTFLQCPFNINLADPYWSFIGIIPIKISHLPYVWLMYIFGFLKYNIPTMGLAA